MVKLYTRQSIHTTTQLLPDFRELGPKFGQITQHPAHVTSLFETTALLAVPRSQKKGCGCCFIPRVSTPANIKGFTIFDCKFAGLMTRL